jgi:hypothetical protein
MKHPVQVGSLCKYEAPCRGGSLCMKHPVLMAIMDTVGCGTSGHYFDLASRGGVKGVGGGGKGSGASYR